MKFFGTVLNRQELVVGSVFGVAWCMFIGWWLLLTVPVCALLWALGGATGWSASIRRLGCPLAVTGALFANGVLPWWQSGLTIILCWAALSVGYGIPSSQPPDPGSRLGKFFWLIFMHSKFSMRQSAILTNYAVRGLISVLLAASFWNLWQVNPAGYFYGCLVMVTGNLLAIGLMEG